MCPCELAGTQVFLSQRKDTVSLEEGQPLHFTAATGQSLRHHEEQVGVLDPLGVEQP